MKPLTHMCKPLCGCSTLRVKSGNSGAFRAVSTRGPSVRSCANDPGVR